MAPPRKHETDRILDAARELVLRDGPRAASVAAIARESGAPAGTLYHRFASRDGLLAAAWLRALERFQQSALAAATSEVEPLERAVAMGISQVSFARERPEDARLLVSLRRDDLLDGDLGALVGELVVELSAQEHALIVAIEPHAKLRCPGRHAPAIF